MTSADDTAARLAASRPSMDAWSCNCIGPQKGQPLCPCQMRGIIQRDGRWIRPEQDLGPVTPEPESELARRILAALTGDSHE